MKPEVWVPAAASLLAPSLQVLVTLIANRRRDSNGAQPAAGPRRPLAKRMRTSAFAAALPVALTVALLPAPYSWTVAAAFLAIFTTAQISAAWLDRRNLRMTPEAEAFMKAHAEQTAGYPYDRDFLPDLVRVYTKNDLTTGTAAAEAQVRTEPPKDAEPEGEQRVSFEKILADPTVKHVAVTGEAGIGKTSMLEFWDHDLRFRQPSRRDQLSRLRPLLIAARALIGKRSVAEALDDAELSILACPPGPDMTWLVMIDAFDEIIDPDQRTQVERIVFDAIDEASSGGIPCKFILTTRGLSEARQRSFDSRKVTVFKLQPFTTPQLREFLIREETSPSEREEENDTYRQTVDKVDTFLNRWGQQDNLLDLIRIPLLARVTATIYFQDQQLELPARRIDIYHDVIEHWISQFHKRLQSESEELGTALGLLHQWHATVRQQCAQDTDRAVRDLLRELAVAWLESGQRSVVSLASEMFDLPVRPKDHVRTEALQTLLQATGLIYDVMTINPRFVHKSYAEYLAAATQLRQFNDLDDWDQALRDPDRRVGAVFALAQMEIGLRNELIDSLAADPKYAITCGLIAIEGLCDSPSGSIDENRRQELVGTCVKSIPAFLSDEWEQLVRSLVSIECARDGLLDLVAERRISNWLSLFIARHVARHDRRGVELLKSITADETFHPAHRILACDDLADHELETGLALLEHFVDDPEIETNLRFSALRWLVTRKPRRYLKRLQRFIDQNRGGTSTSVQAADLLAEHDRDRGVKLLRRQLSGPPVEPFPCVLAAHRLADYDREAGVPRLREYMSDTRLPDHARVSSAQYLVGFDREAGLTRLRELAGDRAINDSARVNAAYDLAINEGRDIEAAMIDLAHDQSFGGEAREQAANSLNHHAPETCRGLLEAIACDTAISDGARINAVEDLAWHDRKLWLPKLREMAGDRTLDGNDRVGAAARLAANDPGQGAPLLKAFVEDPNLDDLARARAAYIRFQYGGMPNTDMLRRFAEDPDFAPAGRVYAALQLAELGRPEGRKLLRHQAAAPTYSDATRGMALDGFVACSGGAGANRLRQFAEDAEVDGNARVTAAGDLVVYDLADAVRILKELASNPDLADADRVRAAVELARHEREAGASLLLKIAECEDFGDEDRHSAARSLAKLQPEPGLSLLREQANNPSLHGSATADAAHQLTIRGIDDGPRLLAECAANDQLYGHARVMAAGHLVECDWEAGLAALHALSSGTVENPWDRVRAANRLAHHDREAGLAILYDLVEDRSCGGMYRALAATRLEGYDAAKAEAVTAELIDDPAVSGRTKVVAAENMMSFDRARGRSLLRRYAENGELPEANRVRAADQLTKYDYACGARVLEDLSLNDSVNPSVRVQAASCLHQFGKVEGLRMLREFAADRSIPGLARVEAAWCLTWSFKRKGLDLLRAIAAEANSDPTVRCWADIARSDWEPQVKADFIGTHGADDDIDLDVLRAAAEVQIEMEERSGYMAARRVRELDAARAGTES